MTRAAAIDIGTNTVLLLVAERRNGSIVPLVDRATITRLGQGVDGARRLDPAAVERTLACLAEYAAEIGRLGVDRIDVVGTSAMRDAGGGAELSTRAAVLLGATPRVASGAEEAQLMFQGALGGLGLRDGPIVVVDIGGGSTEIVVGEIAEGRASLERATSLDIGSVRLTERHVDTDPPTTEALERVRASVRVALERAPYSCASGVRLVGVAGTVTTLAAVSRGLVPYDGARVHGARLARREVDALVDRLAGMPLERRRAVPGLEPERADVIVGGAIIVAEIVRSVSVEEIVVSDRGVRWGLVQGLLAEERDRHPH